MNFIVDQNNKLFLDQTTSILSKDPFKDGVIVDETKTGNLIISGTSKSDNYVKSEILEKDLYCFDDICAIVGNKGAVIDIGAHKGFFSILAAEKFDKVYSFEASDINYEYLKLNKKVNNLKDLNVFFCAVSNENGKVEFYKSTRTDARNTLFPNKFAGKTISYEVDCIKLSTVIEQEGIDFCSLLKIDCEGAEYSILEATLDEDFKKIGVIMLEVHEEFKNIGAIEKLLRRLGALGFDIGITSEKIMSSDFYTAMIIAFNTEHYPEKKCLEFWHKNDRIKPNLDGSYNSYQRNLFLSYDFIQKKLTEVDETFNKSLFAGHKGDPSNLSSLQKIRRLSALAFGFELLFFFSKDLSNSHFKVWEPYLKRLPFKSAVLAQKRNKQKTPESAVTILYEEDGYAAAQFNNLGSLMAVFHPQNKNRNSIFLKNPKLLNVFVGHGDSDKQTSSSPMHNAYGKVFSAGEAAIQRYMKSPIDFPRNKFEIIAAPGHPKIKVGKCLKPIKTILYAPTWEGLQPSANYSSVKYAVKIFETLLTKDPTLKLLFLPHPVLGRESTDYKKLREQLTKLADDSYPKKLDKFQMIEKADVMVADISGVITEFLFTEKPILMLMNPKDADARQIQVNACLDYIYKVEQDSLHETISQIEMSDPLQLNRKRVKAEKYAGCKTFEETSAIFNNVTHRCILEHVNRLTQSKTKSLIKRMFEWGKTFSTLNHPINISLIEANQLNNVMDEAKNILLSANKILFKGELTNNGGSSAAGSIWIKSPYGLVDQKYFSGKKLVLQSIASNWDNALLEEGYILDVVSCKYLSAVSKYKLRVKLKNSEEEFSSEIPSNSIKFVVQ